MSTIQFVVRDPVGILQHGAVESSGKGGEVTLTAGSDVSLNLRRLDISGYIRSGDDLILMLADGSKVVLDNYYGPDGNPQAQLFLSEGGHLIETTVSATSAVSHSEVAEWGKYGMMDALTFPGDPMVVAAAGDATSVESGTETGGDVTMGPAFGLAPLAAAGGSTAGLAALGVGVAGLTALAVGSQGDTSGTDDNNGNTVGGGDNEENTGTGGGDDRIEPTIDNPDDNYAYNGESEQQVTITGTAEPNSTVEVTIGDKTVTTTSDENGEWSATFNGDDFPDDGEYEVEVKVTEPDGTQTELGGQDIVIDTTPPDIDVSGYGASIEGNIVNAVENGAGFSLEGTGEVGATVTLTVGGNTHTTTVGNDGTWSVDFGPGELPTGEYDIDVSITAMDAFGNSTTITHTMTIDTVAPDVEVGPEAQAGDNMISASEAAAGVTITGHAEAGATVVVSNGTASYTTTAGADGTWSVDFAAGDFPGGEYTATITATATDLAGNTNTTTSSIEVDTIGNVTLDAGTGSAGEAVMNGTDQQGSITLTGTTQVGSSVVVTIDGTDYAATVAGDGTWSVDLPGTDFATGEYTQQITVTSTDGAGNTDVTTGTLIVDTETGVTIVPDYAGNDGIVSGGEAAGGVTFTGQAEPGASVAVTFEGTTHTVQADGTGAWSADFAAGEITQGEYSSLLMVTATDSYGNSATATSLVAVDTETDVTVAAPDLGGDSVLNSTEAVSGLILTGTAEAGSSVSVQIGTSTRVATVQPNGDWSVTFPSGTIAGGEYEASVMVTSTDAVGNMDTTSTTMTVDTLVRDFAFTSSPTGGDGVLAGPELGVNLEMTGSVEPGSTVDVSIGNSTRAASVDANGNWTVTFEPGSIANGEYDTLLQVHATDGANNTSTISETVRIDTDAGELALSDAAIEVDDIVNATERGDGVTIEGTATPFMTVTVNMGQAQMQTISDANGTWSVDFPASQIQPGTYTADITASITDAYGNTKSDADTVDIDTVVMNLASDGVVDDNGVVNFDEAADGVDITGTVEPGSIVSVRLGLVSHAATVDAQGNWTVNFAANEVPAGEQPIPITVTAQDMAGNSAMVTDTMVVDTLVNTLSLDSFAGGDGFINASEAAMGLTLTGVVEAGSTVSVNFDGTDHAATVDAQGNWSVDLDAADIGTGDRSVDVVVNAEDAAGNTASTTETVQLDTEAPEAPQVTAYNRAGQTLRGFSVETGDATAEITTLEADGSEGTIGNIQFDNPVATDEVDFYFTEPLPTGSHLIITKTDDAQNESSTLFALEDNGTDVIDLTNPGLADHEIEAIDLTFAVGSEVTIDASTLEGLSGNSNELIINGDSDDKVTIDTSDGSTLVKAAATETIGGTEYDVYTLGDEGGTLYIDPNITVI